MASLIEQNGGGPQKQPKYTPIFMDRSFTGVFTQRSPLHDPSDIYTSKYYGGRPDALWTGSNVELTNRLTLQRRPGLVAFAVSPYRYPTQPLYSYSFQLSNGTIRLIVDTQSTGPSVSETLTSVTASVNGAAVYTGTITGGASNGLRGSSFTVSGFVNSANNGVFACTASTATTLTLANTSAVSETHAGVAATIVLTSVANASGGTTVYTGTITNGGSNAFVGMKFLIAGFTSNANNGTFVVTASSTTTLTLANANGVSETANATAVSGGAVYWDKQDGTVQLLFAKSATAGQTHFIGSGGILYAGDGVDTFKYTPLNTNGTIWNWGIVAPTTQPSVSLTPSGSAATRWQANTNFTTMGLTKDTNSPSLIWQLISVNADGTNTATSQFGTAGTGEPNWGAAATEGTTLVDSGVTWLNMGPVSAITTLTFYTDLGIGGGYAAENFSRPGQGTAVNAVYGNFKNSGGLGETASTLPAFSGVYPGGSGYSNGNTIWRAIGSYNTPTQMAAMRWKPTHSYSTWSPTGANASIAGTPNFVLTGNLPAASGTTVNLFIPKVGGTSGSGYNPFPSTGTFGTTVDDGQLTWLCLGPSLWQANFAYTPWVVQGTPFGCIYDGANFQVCVTGSGGATSGSHIPGTVITTATSITVTNTSTTTTFTRNSGSWSYTPVAGEQIFTSGFANAANNGTFKVVSATSNTIIVSTNTGAPETSAVGVITLNPWATTYGGTTVDGGLVWTCVGQNVPWVAGSGTTGIWHLPTVGFQPPGPSEPFGGSEVAESGFVQAVTNSGTSAASAPSWPVVIGGTVTEAGTAPKPTWQTASAVSTQSLAWSFGLAYAYSFKARALDDFYSPLPLGGGFTPPNAPNLGIPFGSETNAISSASPVNQIVGANTGSVNTIQGDYSSDPQVDTIVIWRSADAASGSGAMFELTEIPNVPALAGVVKWKFTDFLPSVATSTFPGLNTLLPAPINGVNDPPFSTFLPMAYNFQRIWGADGQFVPFSAGPDIGVGNPDEAFAVSDSLPFLAPVTRLVKTPQGLVTFLTDSIEVIAGGPTTSSFFSVTWAPNIGLLSYNALDVFAGEIYFFSSDNQFRVMTPSLNIQNAGFPLGDQFANQPTSGVSDTTWDPAQVYVASHQNGTDNCIVVADGNTGWYRLNPRQAGAMPNPEPVWSPFASITNGCQMVQSVETAPGIKKLLVGSQIQNQPLLYRDQTVYTDNGTQYGASFEMGNITLAHPGQLALLKFVEFDFSSTNFRPTISYLLNEVSGTFTPFTKAPQFDPPSLYGATITPTSYSPNRYYFSGNASLARCRHLRLKVDFGTTSTGDELLTATIFGRLMIET